ncbi:MAG: hypothetical protein C3F14_03620 [Deltaproteobacteria bacterium]|nr:MAG: hypothetical protein C3F14_03620 [Deltaproteobacteria bacterium]
MGAADAAGGAGRVGATAVGAGAGNASPGGAGCTGTGAGPFVSAGIALADLAGTAGEKYQ